MDLRLLEDFLCLNDTRNFSRAAEERCITQSTLSKRIRALEHWVGATLVDRSSYPICLTAEGEAMVPQARELVSMFRGMRAGIRAFATPSRHLLRLATMHTLRLTFMPDWMAQIEQDLGRLEVEPAGLSAAYADTLRHFRNGETDLLLSYVHPAVANGMEGDAFDSLLLGRDVVVPVSAPDRLGGALHPIDEDRVIRFLSYGTSSFFAQALVPMLSRKPLALNMVASNPMSVSLLSLARVGVGVGWVPRALAEADLASGALVLAGGPEWQFGVEIRLFRHRRGGRPPAERFWQAAERLSRMTRPRPTAELLHLPGSAGLH